MTMNFDFSWTKSPGEVSLEEVLEAIEAYQTAYDYLPAPMRMGKSIYGVAPAAAGDTDDEMESYRREKRRRENSYAATPGGGGDNMDLGTWLDKLTRAVAKDRAGQLPESEKRALLGELEKILMQRR